MAGLGTGAGPPVVNVYHEKSMILPDVSRVLTCLYEKEVKFETIKASYKDILSLQASRSVPVPFYDGPVFLQDSRAICRYIAETYEHQGYPFLLGKDVLERASIEQWLRHEEHAFDPPSRSLFCHLAFPLQDEDDDDIEEINREKRKLEEVLEVYEQRLGETEFLAGNKFTLADLVHLPGTHHVITSERFAYLYDSRKNVQRWWNKISARDSWQQVLRDMKTVEEQNIKEELEEQQKQQWQTAPALTFGGGDIRIDPRKQEDTKPQTVLVAAPSAGTISTAMPPAPQDHETTSDQKASSPTETEDHRKLPSPSRQTDPTPQKPPSSAHGTKSTFFTTSTPSFAKTHQQTDAEQPSYRDASLPSKTSQRPPKEAPDKLHPSDSFNGREDEADSLAEPSTQDSPKISRAEPSDAVSTDKPIPQSTKAPHKINEPDSRETESKPTRVDPKVNKAFPLTYTKPDTQTPQTPYVKPPEQRVTLQGESKEDTPDVTSDDRFSTKRLRTMFDPDIEDSQDTAKEEEASAVPKKPSDVHDREKQTTMVPDNGKSGGSPSSGVRAPYAQAISSERRAILPPKGEIATTGAEKSPSVQQIPPGAPGTDKLAEDPYADTRAPQRAELQTTPDAKNASGQVHETDPSTIVTSNEQSDKSSTMAERELEATPKKTPPSDSRSTSAPLREASHATHMKQAPAPGNVQDIGDGYTTKKPVLDKRATEPSLSSQQTTTPIKGGSPTLLGITGDESTKAAPPAPLQVQASSGQDASTVPREGNLDANGKNEAVKPSPADPRSVLPIAPGRLAQTPDTQRPDPSDKMSAQLPPLPSLSDARNKRTDLAETRQASTIAPSEQKGGQATRNARISSSGSTLMKSQEYTNEPYKDGVPVQQMPSDQSGAKLAENRKRQGNDVAPDAKNGKPKEDDFIADADDNNTRQAQATTTNVTSKLQMKYDQNKPELSKNDGIETNKTANSPRLVSSKDVLSLTPEKSMGQQQLQGKRSGTSQQDNVKQGSEAAPLGSQTSQQKEDLPTKYDNKYGKTPGEAMSEGKTSPGSQQVKDYGNNSKSDSSSNSTQLEGNKDNLPESQRRDL